MSNDSGDKYLAWEAGKCFRYRRSKPFPKKASSAARTVTELPAIGLAGACFFHLKNLKKC